MDYDMLRARAEIVRSARAFFDARGYLETLTPALAPGLIPESCLEVFQTRLLPPKNARETRAKPYYLVPSPEVWMKRLIARHRRSIYQIAPAFRNCESTGRTHSPEFLMLEFYTMDADYHDSLALAEALFDELLGKNEETLRRFQPGEALRALRPPFVRLSMDEAFSRFAGFSLLDALERGSLAREASRLGLDAPQDTPDALLYDLLFIHAVEPALPAERPVVLLDYPSIVPCLARRGPDGATYERWELYARGLELANCYSEERDAEAVRRYVEAEDAAKRRGAVVPHAVDAAFCAAFADGGFPRSSGVALGMDRLIMALTGRRTIDGVLPFPMV